MYVVRNYFRRAIRWSDRGSNVAKRTLVIGGNGSIEFRYIDTYDKSKQWHRTAEADPAWARLIKFLDQLGWFPANVLEPLSNEKQ